jgi:hypothetical protein
MMMRARFAACVLSSPLVAACGGSTADGSGGSGGASTGGSGGVVPTGGSSGVGASGGAGGSPGLDITVLDPKEQPIPGAIVVVDEADGTESEAKTDATGVATFPSVDLATGSVDVTAFSPGNVLVSVLGIGATSSKVIHLRPPRGSSKQTITVNFSGKVASDDCVS